MSSSRTRAAKPLAKLGKGDQDEVFVRRKFEEDQVVTLAAKAANLLEAVLDHLVQGERVAVLGEDRELSPTDAVDILGISRPLVVDRMDIGDLPFRYVGKHRRAKMRGVPALNTAIDAQQKAMEALAADAEHLSQCYGV